ncbi:TPA: hypothetical protein ACNZX9_001115 [Streptococcus pyogenes]|nr:hypothetical protein [Streptococcus pyogenes]
MKPNNPYPAYTGQGRISCYDFRGTTTVSDHKMDLLLFISDFLSSATSLDICADFSTLPLSVTDQLNAPLIANILTNL